MAAMPSLALRLTGRLELLRDGQPVALPQSRKTLGLLAYIALADRPHRRDYLSSFLWDVADDPRAALRWSLSKLRPLVDQPGRPRIVADRDSVAFDGEGVFIDVAHIRQMSATASESLSDEAIRTALDGIRGDFLAGLDQPDLMGFHAWCVAEREELRRAHVRLLSTLVDRNLARPETCLEYARELVRLDADDPATWSRLIGLLDSTGRRDEAAEQRALARRHLGAEVPDLPEPGRGTVNGDGDAAALQPSRASYALSGGRAPTAALSVGRAVEQARCIATLDRAAAAGGVLLLTGEPGVGKTHLLAALCAAARDSGGGTLWGSAFEAEAGRPYGPWIDVLRSGHLAGRNLVADATILPLANGAANVRDRSRDLLFEAIVGALLDEAMERKPLVVVLDDIHWCDEASAALLHYAIRQCQGSPVLFALSARSGELADNAQILRLVRQLRRTPAFDEIALEPLDRADVATLVRAVAPAADADRVFEVSAGNPLFALELARSSPAVDGRIPGTLAEVVLERAERLPPAAADVLRWAAVLGRRFTIAEIERLDALAVETIVDALELLERHALIQPVRDERGRGGYDFSHDLVRRVIYDAISGPRRRRMHLHIALAMETTLSTDPSVATEVANHAGLADEPAVAAGACIAAGQWSLRVFANAEARQFAQQGIEFAEQLGQPEQVKLLIELARISLTARRPDEPEAAARRLAGLAEAALDHGAIEHARLGFEALSFLRWEAGDWPSALQNSIKAERVSRSGSEIEHIRAMSETARCLVLLERELPEAEAMLLEAQALARRAGVDPQAIPHSVAMLNFFRGDYETAKKDYERALLIARRDGERMSEFMALEQLVVLDLATRRYGRAVDDTRELVALAEKIREGSEAPLAWALAAISRYAVGDTLARADIDAALDAVRAADAKQRLANALCFAGELEIGSGLHESAAARGMEALAAARQIGRATEIAFAHVISANAALQAGDRLAAEQQLAALDLMSMMTVSAFVRERVAGLRSRLTAGPATSSGGN